MHGDGAAPGSRASVAHPSGASTLFDDTRIHLQGDAGWLGRRDVAWNAPESSVPQFINQISKSHASPPAAATCAACSAAPLHHYVLSDKWCDCKILGT